MREQTNPQASTSMDDVRRTLQIGQRKGRKIVRWVVTVVVVVAIVLGIWIALRRRVSQSAPRWVSEPARRADVHVTVSATGKIQGLNTVEVGAEVTGKVLRVLVDYNDLVKKGQVLAEIDPEQLRAAVEEARAQVLTSTAGIRNAEATLLETRQARDRAEEQAKQGLVSQKDLETARAAAARAEASLASSKASTSLAAASLNSAQSRLAKTKIVAPIDGIVLARAVEPGQTVTAGFQTPILFRLAEDLTKLSLRVDIDEADIGRVVEGAQANFTVDAYPQRSFPSTVRSLHNEPKSSQNVVTYEAVLTVENQERLLRPGMTATASITSQTVKDALVVSNAALRFAPPPVRGAPPPPAPRPDEKRVYILRAGSPAPVSVRVGPSDGHVTEVAGDINVGDEVLVDVILPP
jgi:HlyD family secretion protein